MEGDLEVQNIISVIFCSKLLKASYTDEAELISYRHGHRGMQIVQSHVSSLPGAPLLCPNHRRWEQILSLIRRVKGSGSLIGQVLNRWNVLGGRAWTDPIYDVQYMIQYMTDPIYASISLK